MTIEMSFYFGIVFVLFAYVIMARVWCKIADTIGSMIGLKWLIQRVLDWMEERREREQ